MKIARGIVGIRRIKDANREGWHLIVNDGYQGYSPDAFDKILTTMPDGVLLGVMGNTLHIVTTN